MRRRRRMCGRSRRRMRRRRWFRCRGRMRRRRGRVPGRRRWLWCRRLVRRRRGTRRYRRSGSRMVRRMRRFISMVARAESTVGFVRHQVGQKTRADNIDRNAVLMPKAGVRSRRRRWRRRARRRRQIAVAHSARRRSRRRRVMRRRWQWRNPRADDRHVPTGVGNVKNRARAAVRVRENPAVLIGRDDGVVDGVIPVRTLAGRSIEVPRDHAVLKEPLIVEQSIAQGIGLTGGQVERLRGSEQLLGVVAQLCARADASHDRCDSEATDDVRLGRIGLRTNRELRREKRRGNKTAEQALCRDSQRTSLLQTRARCGAQR
jgi:hypothetical protein